MLKRIFFTAIAAMLLVGGCTDGGHDRVDVAVAGGPDNYDGYYDGFYGTFNDGYWGNDGAFWYSGGDRIFHRDEAHHFQRTAANGFSHIHGTGVHREH